MPESRNFLNVEPLDKIVRNIEQTSLQSLTEGELQILLNDLKSIQARLSRILTDIGHSTQTVHTNAPEEQPGSHSSNPSNNPAPFPKNRMSMIVEFAVLFFIKKNGPNKASSIASVSEFLNSSNISHMTRPTLIVKLHRMRSSGYLDWSNNSRGRDIQITPEGQRYYSDLKSRYLESREIKFLSEKLATDLAS